MKCRETTTLSHALSKTWESVYVWPSESGGNCPLSWNVPHLSDAWSSPLTDIKNQTLTWEYLSELLLVEAKKKSHIPFFLWFKSLKNYLHNSLWRAYFSICYVPVTTVLSKLKAIFARLHFPKLHLNVWGLLGYTEARGSCPYQLMWKDNFIKSSEKKKTLPISCLSFLPLGWKGIRRMLLNTIVSLVYSRWMRAAFDVSAQRRVVSQYLSNQWNLQWVVFYYYCARSLLQYVTIARSLISLI